MQPTKIEEVTAAFSAAKNLNATLKTFLKREAKSGDTIERFAKDFRAAVARGPAAQNEFIERNFAKFEIAFLALARYAHADVVTGVVEKIFEQYADDFNTTYDKIDKGITVKDQARFESILKKVRTMIEDAFRSAALPVSAFLVTAVLPAIFEPEVLTEVIKVL